MSILFKFDFLYPSAIWGVRILDNNFDLKPFKAKLNELLNMNDGRDPMTFWILSLQLKININFSIISNLLNRYIFIYLQVTPNQIQKPKIRQKIYAVCQNCYKERNSHDADPARTIDRSSFFMLRKRFGYVSESTKIHLKAIEDSHTVFTINVFSKVQDLIIMIIEKHICYTEFFQLAEPGNSDEFLVLWMVDRGKMLLTIYMKKKNQNLSPKKRNNLSSAADQKHYRFHQKHRNNH